VSILEKRSELSEAVKQRLFSENAAKLYKLELPA
jgi:predicted TIM-barrel fold metal-dependent hydrolase